MTRNFRDDTLGSDRNISSNTANISAVGNAKQLSFVNRNQGWVNLSGRLFATRDGGRSWLDITPGGPPPPPRVWIQGTPRTVPRGTHWRMNPSSIYPRAR